MKKIVVVGLGYVGLPLAVLLSRNFVALGVDVNSKRVEELQKGICFIKEDDFQEEFNQSHVKKNFVARVKPEEADVFIIAVPTPVYNRTKKPDLSFVKSATEAISPFLRKGNLVILESTVPPLTCRNVVKKIIEEKTSFNVPKDILLAHCPERVLPGNTLYELINNSRIIGGLDKMSTTAAAEIYKTFVKGEVMLTDDVTAEFCKLIENAYRDVNIAFANELSLIAKKLGVDIKEAIAIANKHPRVNIHRPGIGVGGHCICQDPWFLVEVDEGHSMLIQAARKINDSMPAITAEKIISAIKSIKNPKIISVGLTYKPDVGDLRESPAIEVVKILREKGYDVSDYDPLVDGKQYASLSAAAKNADCLAILVEHAVVMKELAAKEKEIKAAMKSGNILRF